MMLVVSYDVNTTDAAGEKRLRKVAKLCEAAGCRIRYLRYWLTRLSWLR